MVTHSCSFCGAPAVYIVMRDNEVVEVWCETHRMTIYQSTFLPDSGIVNPNLSVYNMGIDWGEIYDLRRRIEVLEKKFQALEDGLNAP